MRTNALLLTALVACGLWSCSNEDFEPQQEMGCVQLAATFDSEVSRATDDDLASSCDISIYSSQGLIRHYQGVDAVPSPLWLASGHYTAAVTAGDSVSASWDARYYKGVADFDITKGQATQAEVNCKIANVLASVKYDNQVKDALNSYSMRIGHQRGWLVFEGDDTRCGSFMMPSGVTELTWTLTATTFDGKPFNKSGVIRNVKPATEYRVNIKYTGTASPIGGSILDIDVDATVEEISHDVTFYDEPSISLADGDIALPQQFEKGNGSRLVVTALAPAGMTAAELTGDFDLLGLEGVTQMNVLNPSETETAQLYSKGINVLKRESDEQGTTLVLNFSEKLISLLPVNTYKFNLNVTDSRGHSATATLTIEITKPGDTPNP